MKLAKATKLTWVRPAGRRCYAALRHCVNLAVHQILSLIQREAASRPTTGAYELQQHTLRVAVKENSANR